MACYLLIFVNIPLNNRENTTIMGYNLRFRVLRATDFKILEKTHTVLINIKNFE
jgi:hypothetical protein